MNTAVCKLFNHTFIPNCFLILRILSVLFQSLLTLELWPALPLLLLPHPLHKATPSATCNAVQRNSLVWRDVWDLKENSRTSRILYLGVGDVLRSCFCFFFFFFYLSFPQHTPYPSSFMK